MHVTEDFFRLLGLVWLLVTSFLSEQRIAKLLRWQEEFMLIVLGRRLRGVVNSLLAKSHGAQNGHVLVPDDLVSREFSFWALKLLPRIPLYTLRQSFLP